MRGVGFGVDERASESVLLHNSVKSNEQHLVAATIARGADVNFICGEEAINVRTPLRSACTQANIKVIRMLLEHGADVHAHFENDRWTALHSAAHAGHDHIIRLLIVEVEELHENLCHDGFSLLHLLLECLNMNLLNHGQDLIVWALRHMPTVTIDAKSTRLGYDDWTPFHIACARGWSKAAMVLMRAHCEVVARTGEFHIGSGAINIFAQGDEHGGAQVANIEPNFQEVSSHMLDSGLTAIHLAAFGGHLRTVQMLVKAGQSINVTTSRHKWTPLMFAVWSGNVQLVSEVCRTGGRAVINCKDRRADGTEWTPLAIAVAKCCPEMIKTLISFGADPLVRLGNADFPGQTFIQHIEPCLADGTDNHWSGSDARISMLHLAVTRGNVRILNTVYELMRAAHFGPPVRSLAGKHSSARGTAGQDPRATGSTSTSTSGFLENGSAQALSRSSHDRKSERHVHVPGSESQDCDPVVFCTSEGWSPAVLAVMLHTVDPMRDVSMELFKAFPDPDRGDNTRADLFLELLKTGRSLLEDRPEASPPVMPQRFHDVSETLVSHVIDEFVQLCKANGSEMVALRITHATLCVACRFNRLQVAKYLLDAGLCDPRCRFLKPVECRPLHIATACGFGYLAQMLLEHKADPLEADENAELPVFKLARFYSRQISSLQGRVAELESQLAEAHSSKNPLSDGHSGYPMYTSAISTAVHPNLTTHIHSLIKADTAGMSSRM